eukprot:549842-Lingulodinium_polyedra.AAC.1
MSCCSRAWPTARLSVSRPCPPCATGARSGSSRWGIFWQQGQVYRNCTFGINSTTQSVAEAKRSCRAAAR